MTIISINLLTSSLLDCMSRQVCHSLISYATNLQASSRCSVSCGTVQKTARGRSAARGSERTPVGKLNLAKGPSR